MNNTFDLDIPSLQTRITNILKDPRAEWPVIEAERPTTEKLYRSYIAPLAAISAICGFIGMTIVGITLPFVGTYRESLPRGFANMVVSFVLTLVGVYVAALVVNKLAPTFDSKPDEMQALKLVAYAQTPAWLAGVVTLIPALGPLVLVGVLYAVYLFYLGLPILMKTPREKVIPYLAVSAVVCFGLAILLGIMAAAFTGVARI